MNPILVHDILSFRLINICYSILQHISLSIPWDQLLWQTTSPVMGNTPNVIGKVVPKQELEPDTNGTLSYLPTEWLVPLIPLQVYYIQPRTGQTFFFTSQCFNSDWKCSDVIGYSWHIRNSCVSMHQQQMQ